MQDKELGLPVEVQVTDVSGNRYRQLVHMDHNGRWTADFNIKSALQKAEIDPDRDVFDWDRFNNSSDWPRMYFLPGDARTFRDDAYTTLWLPLLSKLPGEPLTWMVVASSSPYLHSNYSLLAGYAPETNQKSVSFYYLKAIPRLGAFALFDVIQNRGVSYAGERLLEGYVSKTNSLWRNPVLEVGLRLRQRETLGDKESRHVTGALTARLSPLKSSATCRYLLGGESEGVLQARSEASHYQRRLIFGEVNCKSPNDMQIELRSFGGKVSEGMESEPRVRFSPQDLSQAKIRIDRPTLEKVSEIATAGIDLLVPMPLPLPESMLVVKRQTRLRGFYDAGRSWKPRVDYRASGLGVWLPFGGDVAGKGSIQVLNVSVLAVLYRSYGEDMSRAPGILLDFGFANR